MVLIFTAFSVGLANEWRSGMIWVRGSDGRMKAVCHFDRFGGGACASNSPYSGTTFELCIFSDITAWNSCPARNLGRSCKVQRLECGSFHLQAKLVEMSMIKGVKKEKGCTGGWRRHSRSYWARKSIFHSSPSSGAHTAARAAAAGATVADSQLSN